MPTENTAPETTVDVAVVGAGPTGLLLAGDLAAAGVSVVLLEKRLEESNLTRAFAVHARTLEELDIRGVADELVAVGKKVPNLRVFGKYALDLSWLPGRFPYLLVAPQYETERVLKARAEELGVRIVRGARVTGLRQDADGVDLDVAGRDGGATAYRASYVVGTDGMRSAVREAIGVPFPGEAVLRSIMLADVRLTDPPEDVLTFNGVGDAFTFVVPFGDGYHRIIAWNRDNQPSDDVPVDMDELKDVARRSFGTDFGMHSPRWTSRFHSDERQAPSYRVGRVFLAGDAAHVHSPAGGQGMNTGLQDAANLGWKLAAVVNGRASDGLLDTYEAERHPVGKAVLKGSGALLRMAVADNPVVRAVRNTVAATVTNIPAVVHQITGIVSGIAIHYKAPRGAHKLVGHRAEDVALIHNEGEPARLYEALRTGMFVLVGAPDAPAELASPEIVSVTAAEPIEAPMLVRPDGYIAWAGERADQEDVMAALAHYTVDA